MEQSKIYAFLLISLLFISCGNKPTPVQSVTPVKSAMPQRSADDLLTSYFSEHEIKPSLIVNNTDNHQKKIKLADHKITWMDTDDETRIRIDNDLFTLKGKVTLNDVWNSGKDSVDFVNTWDQIKLYKLATREIICIRMNYSPCTGLACSVNYYLIYDVINQTKNFFGTFRIDDEMNLYHFRNEDTIDYVAKTYSGGEATPAECLYQLYTIDKNGQFKVQQNASGSPYQLTTFPDDSTHPGRLEQNWITPIK
jgi:hypothetical protein